MPARKTLSVITTAVALGLLTGGCATDGGKLAAAYEDAAKNPFVQTNYRAAETLLAQLQGRLSAGQPLIIATAVNIDALDRSSTLGRLLSEQVSARFAQNGYRMVEMKFRNNVFMSRNQGEFMLTRELQDIATSHDAQAVIVGIYGESPDYVYINLKVIQPHNNVILAAHDYVLPNDTNARAMLRASR